MESENYISSLKGQSIKSRAEIGRLRTTLPQRLKTLLMCLDSSSSELLSEMVSDTVEPHASQGKHLIATNNEVFDFDVSSAEKPK